MIKTKIMILYFEQIRHNDDFPSTGTRLVILTSIAFIDGFEFACGFSQPVGTIRQPSSFLSRAWERPCQEMRRILHIKKNDGHGRREEKKGAT